MGNFKERWNIKSNWQLTVIIVVFAITGSTAGYLSKPILAAFNVNRDNPWEYWPLYVLLIFPVYQPLLVFFGFIFGQFKFFWAFEKKMLRACGLGFIANWFEKK
ncbi:MAG TPA: diacylglyceryl transferase [Flavobacterium sp.]|uniref:DUF6787 family protein n=1 Tax=Flavobacterium sp. TaxID=239 RepID=UPI002C6617AE|nr:DUF6787 family protein [Flavobacterium sp.]HNP33522.1 diacylglyceryl transferase [Flavobacterium sp.]